MISRVKERGSCLIRTHSDREEKGEEGVGCKNWTFFMDVINVWSLRKGLSIKQQIFDYYQRFASIFLTKPKDIVLYYSLFGRHIVALTKSYQKNHTLVQTCSFREYWKNFNWSVVFKSFLPFSCKRVTSAIFKQDGNENDLKELLMIVHKKVRKYVQVFFDNFKGIAWILGGGFIFI